MHTCFSCMSLSAAVIQLHLSAGASLIWSLLLHTNFHPLLLNLSLCLPPVRPDLFFILSFDCPLHHPYPNHASSSSIQSIVNSSCLHHFSCSLQSIPHIFVFMLHHFFNFPSVSLHLHLFLFIHLWFLFASLTKSHCSYTLSDYNWMRLGHLHSICTWKQGRHTFRRGDEDKTVGVVYHAAFLQYKRQHEIRLSTGSLCCCSVTEEPPVVSHTVFFPTIFVKKKIKTFHQLSSWKDSNLLAHITF